VRSKNCGQPSPVNVCIVLYSMYTLGCNNKLFGPLYHVPDPLAASSSHAELGPVLSPVLVTSPGYPHHYSH